MRDIVTGIYLAIHVWGVLLAIAFLIRNRVEKRIDPIAVERRYENQRFMDKWNRYGRAWTSKL